MDMVPIVLLSLGIVLGVAATGFWLTMLVHCVRTDRLRKPERLAWTLAIVFGKLVGAGAYYLVGIRRPSRGADPASF